MVSLEDSEGQAWTSVTADPAGGYPTSLWQAGDIWRGQLNLSIPGDIPPGRYQLRVGLLDPDGAPIDAPWDVLLSQPLRIEP